MMKKILVLMLAISLLFPMVIADQFQISKTNTGGTIISELSNPAVFDFVINNSDGAQRAEMYSFVGISFDPSDFFNLDHGTNEMEVKAYPNEQVRAKSGSFNFENEIKGDISGITKDFITIKIVSLKDVLSVTADNVNVGDNSVNLMVKNTENTNVENATLHFTSALFDSEKTISLGPYQSTNVSIEIDKSKIKSLASGQYTFNSEVTLGNAKAESESTLNYVPKEQSELSKSGSGFVIRKTAYTRTNTGNVVLTGNIEITKDVLSRLFTISSASPLQVKRQAFSATSIWEKSLQPGEAYTISSTTNYTFPFILLLLVVIVALLVRMYSRTNLVIDKRVAYVKTRGGEFALKVTLHVKAKKYVDNVQIIDRLPGMTQLYEKFGIMPDKIDHASRRLFWNIERLNSGEERVYSYIVYSKVRVVGRFELPAATATFLREGKTEQVFSNRAFFVAETSRTDF